MAPLDRFVGRDYCYVTTRGRRTGRAHEIEIWFALAGDVLYLLAEESRSDWVLNMRAEPEVSVRFGGESFAGRARVGVDGEEALGARARLASKYQGWREGAPMSDWARTGLAVAVHVRTS